jgi:hypothetical protein
MAPIELVLGTPLLLFLAAAIFSIGRAWTARVEADVEARHQAWLARETPSSSSSLPVSDAANTSMFVSDSSPFGLQEVTASRAVALHSVAFSPATATASAAHAVLGGTTWDHRLIPFQPSLGPLTLDSQSESFGADSGGLSGLAP